jgi:hypothetical protein
MAYQYDAPLSFLVESSSTFVEGEQLARCIWKSVAFSVGERLRFEAPRSKAHP